MAHQRTLIRQAAIATLIAANTAAGSRVEDSRIDAHKKGELPAITVFTLGDEEVDMDLSAQSAPRELTRKLELLIVGFVAHTDAVPAALAMDNLAAQIEAALDIDRYISGALPPLTSGTAAESILASTSTDIREGDGRSDPLVGIVTLTYEVTYRTDAATTGTLVDLGAVDVKFPLPGASPDTPIAEDTFTVQES